MAGLVGGWVVEVQADDRRVQRGFFDFIQLPRQGDRVTLPNERGKLDVMGVVQVEHARLPECQSTSAIRAQGADSNGIRPVVRGR